MYLSTYNEFNEKSIDSKKKFGENSLFRRFSSEIKCNTFSNALCNKPRNTLDNDSGNTLGNTLENNLENNSQKSDFCLICFDNKSNCIFNPCGHSGRNNLKMIKFNFLQ